MNIPILLVLFILAIVTHAWSDSDKSMNAAVNRVTATKMDENKGIVQKKKKPIQNPVRLIKKGSSKSQSALRSPDEGTALASTRKHVDFLKAVEEKRRARWVDIGQILQSPEFLRSTCSNDLLTSRKAPTTKSSNVDFSQSIPKRLQADSKFEGGTQLEILRHLESKKEEILREIFMGLRFSFTPTSRHVVLEMNVIPSYERGPGLNIPF